jgi:hypothetical protein
MAFCSAATSKEAIIFPLHHDFEEAVIAKS